MKLVVGTLLPILAFGAVLAVGQANAADAAQGEYLFKTVCAKCHSLEPGSHRTGPSLHRVWGRAVGAEQGFDYSESFQEAYAEGLTWTPENLESFVKRPRSLIRKNKMAYLGMRDDAERADLLAYLKQVSQ